jgi:methylmalonyl-CoA mutase N-terminal domain/subunit
MRIITDIFGFCSTQVPRWNTISVSGYHIREAGSTALRSSRSRCATASSTCMGRRRRARRRRLRAAHVVLLQRAQRFLRGDRQVPRGAQDLGDGDARSVRRKSERSWKLRFHSQTAGVSLTAQQPYNNVVRTALQALAAVLGGTNSLHTNSLRRGAGAADREAATLALRTQQIIAHESGVDQRRRSARRVVLRRAADAKTWKTARCLLRDHRSDGRDGRSDRARLSAEGNRGKLLPRSSRPSNARKRSSSASTTSCSSDEPPIAILYIDDTASDTQLAKLEAAAAHARRGRRRTARLDALRAAAQGTTNLMPSIVDAVRAYVHRRRGLRRPRDVWGE